MSVAQKIVSPPLKPAGFEHMRNALGVQVASATMRVGGSSSTKTAYAQTQTLVIRNTSWAQTNLDMTIASAAAASDDEVAAAEAAVARMLARKDENVGAWAEALGRKLGSIVD